MILIYSPNGILGSLNFKQEQFHLLLSEFRFELDHNSNRMQGLSVPVALSSFSIAVEASCFLSCEIQQL